MVVETSVTTTPASIGGVSTALAVILVAVVTVGFAVVYWLAFNLVPRLLNKHRKRKG